MLQRVELLIYTATLCVLLLSVTSAHPGAGAEGVGEVGQFGLNGILRIIIIP